MGKKWFLKDGGKYCCNSLLCLNYLINSVLLIIIIQYIYSPVYFLRQIPIIMLVVEVPHDLIASSTSNMQSSKEESSAVSGEQDVNLLNDMASLEDSALQKCLVVKNDSSSSTKSVRIDISFKTPSHTGLQTSGLVIHIWNIAYFTFWILS